ncbi:hypothetical protein ACVMB0_002940 [Bradyrhizobium sp. USDA 4451]
MIVRDAEPRLRSSCPHIGDAVLRAGMPVPKVRSFEIDSRRQAAFFFGQ